jgi:eukaryotic-like serine/threonine-protein kinase
MERRMTLERSTVTVDQIGRYSITGELGRGGMGIVYRGEDPLIGRDVAIKTLTEVTPELRERFYLEARSGILNHPNIVTVYELGEHEGSPFIAMEFIAGESLEKMLRRVKRLPVVDAVSIIEQLCAGLGYAHGHGVVHRDVKPANVLIQPDGRVTIVDFGIARLADQTKQLTQTDALLGTFHYIAPERLKGELSDGRADIWSAGIMLYEMLTGELPFKGKDISSLYRVIHEPFVPLSEFVQDLPKGMSGILDKALAKELEDRYATAEEMALDLHAVSNMLRRDRMNSLLETARRLTEEQQFASARTVLLQAQHIDPGNLDAKALIDEVQDRLNHLQRGEQLRQIVEQAQNALTERRWDDAIASFQQAQRIDTDNVFGLNERLREAQEQKQQQQKVAALWEQATEARSRGDLTGAQEFLGQALQIDEHSTDLRNAYSAILREIRRKRQALKVEELLRSARESFANRRYTEAITQLRDAAEVDPAHVEVQQLLFTAASRQKEERLQLLLEKIAAEIQESLDREDFAQAQDRVARALETLPGEALLLRLKAEVGAKKREFDTQLVIRNTVLQAQELFADHPEKALQVVESGLEQAPGNETLLQSKAQLQEHLETLKRNAARTEALLKAHAAMDAKNFTEARRVLEETILVYGSSEDLDQLLVLATEEQAKEEQRQSKFREAAEIRAAVEQAAAGFDRALAAANLKTCMSALDDVAKLHGESSVASVRAECEIRRRRKADQILQETIKAARQSLDRGSSREALNALRKVETAATFATPVVQSDYARLIRECEARPNKKQKLAPDIAPRKRAVWYAAGLAVVAAAVAVAGLLHIRHEKAPAPQAVPVTLAAPVVRTDMEINAAPWAKVVRVQDEAGKDIALPDGDRTTPLRLDGLKAGGYKVTIAGPEGQQQTVNCRLSSANHLCVADISAPDIQQVLTGDQR